LDTPTGPPSATEALQFSELAGPTPSCAGQPFTGAGPTPAGASGPPPHEETGRDLVIEVRRQFAQLASRCMALDPDQRPSFDEATLQLDRLRRNLAVAMEGM
jgi:hypothetical protein